MLLNLLYQHKCADKTRLCGPSLSTIKDVYITDLEHHYHTKTVLSTATMYSSIDPALELYSNIYFHGVANLAIIHSVLALIFTLNGHKETLSWMVHYNRLGTYSVLCSRDCKCIKNDVPMVCYNTTAVVAQNTRRGEISTSRPWT